MTEEQRLAMIASVTGLKRSDEAKKNYSKATKDTITALNIETGVTTRIPIDLFYSRKDIYFTHTSQVYKDWKYAEMVRNGTLDDSNKPYGANSGTVIALNIETGVTTRIPTELFHSRKDIYFHASSKEYRKWKANTKLQPT